MFITAMNKTNEKTNDEKNDDHILFSQNKNEKMNMCI